MVICNDIVFIEYDEGRLGLPNTPVIMEQELKKNPSKHNISLFTYSRIHKFTYSRTFLFNKVDLSTKSFLLDIVFSNVIDPSITSTRRVSIRRVFRVCEACSVARSREVSSSLLRVSSLSWWIYMFICL